MTVARTISEAEIAELEAKAKKIKGILEMRRLQSVLLRAKEKLSAEAIAARLGINRRTVEKHHARYFQEGMSAFSPRKAGPKGPRLMDVDEEQALLSEIEEQAVAGKVLRAREVKTSFETKLGRGCGWSTIYRLLHRHGWSKKQPRPQHPKGDEEAKRLFKKITRNLE